MERRGTVAATASDRTAGPMRIMPRGAIGQSQIQVWYFPVEGPRPANYLQEGK